MAKSGFEEADNATSQPGVLEYGLFVTLSRSVSGGTHTLWIRGVTRHGEMGLPWKRRWTTTSMPSDTYIQALSQITAMFTEEIEHRLGIQPMLFPDRFDAGHYIGTCGTCGKFVVRRAELESALCDACWSRQVGTPT